MIALVVIATIVGSVIALNAWWAWRLIFKRGDDMEQILANVQMATINVVGAIVLNVWAILFRAGLV